MMLREINLTFLVSFAAVEPIASVAFRFRPFAAGLPAGGADSWDAEGTTAVLGVLGVGGCDTLPPTSGDP
jgi:hypothetical protein